LFGEKEYHKNGLLYDEKQSAKLRIFIQNLIA